jgi:hypothetical protein
MWFIAGYQVEGEQESGYQAVLVNWLIEIALSPCCFAKAKQNAGVSSQ